MNHPIQNRIASKIMMGMGTPSSQSRIERMEEPPYMHQKAPDQRIPILDGVGGEDVEQVVCLGGWRPISMCAAGSSVFDTVHSDYGHNELD